MVLVFTCTLMIHGHLGPDKIERSTSASLLGIYKSFRSEGLITKLRWQTRGGRLPTADGYTCQCTLGLLTNKASSLNKILII